ncbi:MAG: hypothetical protein NTU43_09370 [Bacteroidetes bacterium]|nr:hypothetical protein [Bacteroidota bacterium]
MNILKKQYLFLLTLFLLFKTTSFAQGEYASAYKQAPRPIHSLGAGLGFTTGYGLSYRYTPSKFGVQVNFAPYKTADVSKFSTGLTFLYRLTEGETTSLYLYEANHYYSSSEMVWDNPSNKNVRKDEAYFNNGVGFGVEIMVASKIGLNLMTGYASYKNGTELNITGEAALYFKF